MKLTKKKKKFIRDNYETLSIEELSKQSKISQKEIKKYIDKELNTKNSKIRKKAVAKDMERENIKSFHDLWEFIKASRGILGIIVVLCILVYANAMGGDFVSDDISGYLNNTYVHTLGGAIRGSLGMDPTVYYEGPTVTEILRDRYHYILTFYGTFYAFFGANEIPLHILSLISHLLATSLLYIFVSMIFNKRVGIISALLFAVHPINTEAVVWISARKYLVMAEIIFTTCILYTIYKNTKDKRYLIIATAYFSIILYITWFMWLVILPAILIVVDQFFIERKINLKSALYTLPIGLPAFAFGIFYLYSKFFERVSNLETIYNFDREATEPVYTRVVYTIYKTMELYIWPKNLALYHEGEIFTTGLFAVMALVVLVVFVGGIVYFWKRDIRISGLILITLVALGPTLSPVQVAWLIADRYLYVPGFAFTTIVALGMIKLERKTKINNLTVYLLIALLTAYSIRTMVRNRDWRTRQTVWESTQRISPRSPRVYNNLGDVYGKMGDSERSIASFQQAIKLDPDYAEATHNLGNAYARIGEIELAKQAYYRAQQLKPSQYQTYHMLAVLELQQGNYEKAKSMFEEVLAIDPNYAPSQQGLQLANEAIATGGAIPEIELRQTQ